MASSLTNLISFLKNEYIPFLQKLYDANDKLLRVAKIHARNCLISSTISTVVSTVAAGTFIGASIVATVVTGGVAIVPIVGAIGSGVSVAGGLTGFGTVLVNRALEKSDTTIVQVLMDEYNEKAVVFVDTVARLIEFHGAAPQFHGATIFPNVYVALKAIIGGIGLPTDERVQVSELTDGDHKLRPLDGKVKGKLGTHHGVCIDDGEEGCLNVVHFSKRGRQITISGMDAFLGERRSELCRRNYNGLALPVCETVAMARNMLKNGLGRRYSLYSFNCEHFATLLKLGEERSKQVHRVAAFMAGINASIGRVVKGGAEVASTIGIIIAKLGLADDGLNAASKLMAAAPNWGKVATYASFAITPVCAAADIGMLVYEFKRTKPNIEKMTAFEIKLKDILGILLECLHELETFKEESEGFQKCESLEKIFVTNCTVFF